MKGYNETPSFLLEFKDENIYNRFKLYAKRENIVNYIIFENDRKISVVIDRKWEEKIF